jgi:hypothetical protein
VIPAVQPHKRKRGQEACLGYPRFLEIAVPGELQGCEKAGLIRKANVRQWTTRSYQRRLLAASKSPHPNVKNISKAHILTNKSDGSE